MQTKRSPHFPIHLRLGLVQFVAPELANTPEENEKRESPGFSCHKSQMFTRALKTTGKAFAGWMAINLGIAGVVRLKVGPGAGSDFLTYNNRDTTRVLLDKYEPREQKFLWNIFQETSRTVTLDEDTNTIHIKWHDIKPKPAKAE